MKMHLDLKSNMNTDGRTYERDEDGPSVAIKGTGCNARGSESEPTLIGELLIPADLWPTDRHPVTRTGDREPIAPHVRAAVWLRDQGKCELCGEVNENQPWHLDHITPWSAGGSDKTTNLRVLCERHNLDRSNRVDATERPRRAATWWCVNCYDRADFRWDYAAGVACGIHHTDALRPKTWCRVARAYATHREREGVWPTWHQVEPVVSPATLAYCAHCDAPGMTDRPL